MVEPEDVPGPHAEFDALARAQLSDVAEAGRRIERAHRIRPRSGRGPRLRVVAADPEPRRTFFSRVPLFVKYLMALAVVAAVVVVSLAFPAHHDPPHNTPAVRPDVVIASDRLFPSRLATADHGVYQRVTTSTSGTCAQGPGVPQALADAAANVGGCEAIQLALYVDAQRSMHITVGVITMQEVSEMQAVNDAILHSGGATMVGMLPPPPSAGLPHVADDVLRPAYVTPTGSAIVIGVGAFFDNSSPNADALRQAITEVMGTVTQALITNQPAATVSRPIR